MIQTKVALGLVTMAALFAVSVTPAAAVFTNHGGKGKGTGSASIFTYENATVRCGGSTVNYKVNSTGTALTLESIVWQSCLSKIAPEATVTCKTIEMKQPNKEGTSFGQAQGAITESCTLSAAGCVITVGTGGNNALSSINLTKSSIFLDADFSLSGITATTNGNLACSTGGAGKTKTIEAEEKAEFTLEGVGVE